MAWGLESGASVTHHRSSDSAEDCFQDSSCFIGLRRGRLFDRLQPADSPGCITGGELRRPDLEYPGAVPGAIDPLPLNG